MVTQPVQISSGNEGQPDDDRPADRTPEDARELARLRARVAELEAAQAASSPRPPAGRHDTTRSFISALLIVVACLLAPLSVLSVWASTVVSQTDRYVETVAPIADDPGVQAAITDEVTAAVMENLNVADVTTQALQVLSEQENMPPRVAAALPALAGPLTRGIEDFTRTQTGNFVASDQFETVWAEVNRVAHAQLVSLLEGDTSGAITAQDNQITLNLAPVIEEVSARLVDQGFELAANVPAVDRTFVLAESEGIGQAQRFYGILNALGVWLPIVAVALLAAGVLLAADRRRALLRGSLGVAVAMIALGAGLTLVRTFYVETTPADILTADTAGNVFDMLVRFLRTSLRATGVLALLVALAAFVTGPAPVAVRIRSVVDRGMGHARGSADDAGWHLDTVGRWVYRYKSTLWMITFVVAGLALMFWDSPTVGDVVLVALIVTVVLAVIAFLGRPPLVRNVGEEPAERLPMGSSESAQPDDVEKRSSLAGEAATPSEAVETKP